MSRQRAAMASALLCPSVECSASSWRLRFVSATVSSSMSVSSPTPERTSASTA